MKMLYAVLCAIEILLLILSIVFLDTRVGLDMGYLFLALIVPLIVMGGFMLEPIGSATRSSSSSRIERDISRIRINSDIDRISKIVSHHDHK